MEARENLLEDLLRACYGYVDRFADSEGQTICQRGKNGKECDACNYGSLLQSLRGCKLWPKREASSIEDSARHVSNNLRNLKIYSYPHQSVERSNNSGYYNSYRYDHQDSEPCDVSAQLNGSITKIMALETSRVLDSQKHHLEIQKEKLSGMPESSHKKVDTASQRERSGELRCPNCDEELDLETLLP